MKEEITENTVAISKIHTDKMAVVDLDGDCVPDVLTINIRWLLAAVSGLAISAIGLVFARF